MTPLRFPTSSILASFLGPWIVWLRVDLSKTPPPHTHLFDSHCWGDSMRIWTASIFSEWKRQTSSILSRESSVHLPGSNPQPGTLQWSSILTLYSYLPIAWFTPSSRFGDNGFLIPKANTIINENLFPLLCEAFIFPKGGCYHSLPRACHRQRLCHPEELDGTSN